MVSESRAPLPGAEAAVGALEGAAEERLHEEGAEAARVELAVVGESHAELALAYEGGAELVGGKLVPGMVVIILPFIQFKCISFPWKSWITVDRLRVARRGKEGKFPLFLKSIRPVRVCITKVILKLKQKD